MTSVPDAKTAGRLAKELVSKRLAACVSSIGPADSVYRWKGKIERSKEKILLVKTTQARYAAVEELVRRIHPYDLPEIVAVRVEKGSPEYLKWIFANTA